MDPGPTRTSLADQSPWARVAQGIVARERAHPTDSPGVPAWALAMSEGSTVSRRVALKLDRNGAATQVDCDIVVRTGRDAALVKQLAAQMDRAA